MTSALLPSMANGATVKDGNREIGVIKLLKKKCGTGTTFLFLAKLGQYFCTVDK